MSLWLEKCALIRCKQRELFQDNFSRVISIANGDVYCALGNSRKSSNTGFSEFAISAIFSFDKSAQMLFLKHSLLNRFNRECLIIQSILATAANQKKFSTVIASEKKVESPSERETPVVKHQTQRNY